MRKPMLDTEWDKNVGTAGSPVSFLHEYAVGLIWGSVNANIGLNLKRTAFHEPNIRPVTLPTLEGGMSDDLSAGVDKVIIPDNLNSVAGYLPDLLCLQDSRPVRVIEVVVTSPLPPAKLKAFGNLGLEVVQVPVKNEDELMALFPSTFRDRLEWWSYYPDKEDRAKETEGQIEARGRTSIQAISNSAINEFACHLMQCDPEHRRAFLTLMRDIGNLESLYPLSPDTPKYEALVGAMSNELT